MRKLALKSIFFYAIMLSLSGYHLAAQTGNTTVNQDPKFEQLLNEKRRILAVKLAPESTNAFYMTA